MATDQAAAVRDPAGPAAGLRPGGLPQASLLQASLPPLPPLPSLPPCPWCGSASALEVRGDGFGQMAMACGTCGAAGPQVKLAGDLSDADRRAAALWSGRRHARPVARDTVNRVGMAVRMHCLTGRLTPEATIGVAWGDLDALLRSVAVAEAPAAG